MDITKYFIRFPSLLPLSLERGYSTSRKKCTHTTLGNVCDAINSLYCCPLLP